MSSGSLKQFLKKTKKNNKTLKVNIRFPTFAMHLLTHVFECLVCAFFLENPIGLEEMVYPDSFSLKVIDNFRIIHYILK